MEPKIILMLYIVLFVLEYLWERFLGIINMRYVLSRGELIPDFVQGIITPEEYRKSIKYTLTKEKFGIIANTASSIFLLLLILSGFLGFMDSLISGFKFDRYTYGVIYILFIVLIFRLFALPFSLYGQFSIEERFGFNKMTLGLFFVDLLKSLVLSAILFIPLLYLLFFFMDKAGNFWWFYAFGIFTLVQFFIMFLYPTVIAPLFNKFTPLEEGTLRDRIFTLAEKLGFRTKGIYKMDGSRRSGHSNAYFTGIGKSKRIVLYDTLIDSLKEEELVAVLAHEIGHEKKHHIKKELVLSLIGSLAGFFIISLLLQFPPFFKAFGFTGPSFHAVLILLMFCSGPFTFFIKPVFSILSRKYEYEADRFAVTSTDAAESLKSALISLHKNNSGNLTPHPLYSFYYYSHPTLAERVRAIENVTQ
ncbi:MAG: M48 family metallopeptidase [Spirochaetales bacterium]|nr:M48 family metallopeptidase [Spirochaetales bacterium]